MRDQTTEQVRLFLDAQRPRSALTVALFKPLLKTAIAIVLAVTGTPLLVKIGLAFLGGQSVGVTIESGDKGR